MAKYTITFERKVVEFDRYTCEIDADTDEEAGAKADAMCAEFDRDCPEVDETIQGECDSWYVNDLDEVAPADLLRRRDDVVRVNAMPDGTFETVDDAGDEFEGDYAATVAWLDAGLDTEEA